jgi:hypothetical protein
VNPKSDRDDPSLELLVKNLIDYYTRRGFSEANASSLTLLGVGLRGTTWTSLYLARKLPLLEIGLR